MKASDRLVWCRDAVLEELGQFRGSEYATAANRPPVRHRDKANVRHAAGDGRGRSRRRRISVTTRRSMRLEAKTAKLLGKEAAVFVPSGTMANQIAIGVHTQPGDELLCAATSHVYVWEAGGIARLWGVTARTFAAERRILSLDHVRDAIRPGDDVHYIRSRLICLENTHNRGGGRIQPIDQHRRNCPVGSRAQPGHASGWRTTDERRRGLGDCWRTSGRAISTRSRFVFPRGWGLRSARHWRVRAMRSVRHGDCANCWAAGCARLASSPPAALYAARKSRRSVDRRPRSCPNSGGAFASTEGFALENGPVETNLVWVAVNPSMGTAADVAASCARAASSSACRRLKSFAYVLIWTSQSNRCSTPRGSFARSSPP